MAKSRKPLTHLPRLSQRQCCVCMTQAAEQSTLDASQYLREVDEAAYLYLGPRDSLLNEPVPAGILLDRDYMAELQRRVAITGEGPMGDQADPRKIVERDSNPFFYDPDELNNLPTMLPDAPSALSGKGK
jgi:hypothetical protein